MPQYAIYVLRQEAVIHDHITCLARLCLRGINVGLLGPSIEFLQSLHPIGWSFFHTDVVYARGSTLSSFLPFLFDFIDLL